MKKPDLWRRAAGRGGPTVAPPIVNEVLGSPGQALDKATRADMEPRFGHDFSQVRIHTDARAARSARAVDALAYTVAQDVVFAAGQYQPASAEGKRLLAHELTHVVQQGDAGGKGACAIGKPDDPQEREADRAAAAVTAGTSPEIVGFGSPALRRYSHEDCTEDDLKAHIWPADGFATQMTAKAIRVLGMNPLPASVTALFPKYFMTSSPDLAAILKVFRKVDKKFTSNDYTYECEDDCDGTELGYVYTLGSHVHLCMNHLRGLPNDCIGRTMVHEFTHDFAGTDDNGYCKSGCSFASCPASLPVADALENADSYACFAYELRSLAV